MHLRDADAFGVKPELPRELARQLTQRAHVDHTYDPDARAWDQETAAQATPAPSAADEDVLPANFEEPSLDE